MRSWWLGSWDGAESAWLYLHGQIEINDYVQRAAHGCSGRLLGPPHEEGAAGTDSTELVLFGLFFEPLFETSVLRYLLLHLLELESCRLLGCSSLTEEDSYLGLVL